MKTILLICSILVGANNTGKPHLLSHQTTAKRVSRTARVTINAPVEKAFPLFGAFEEKKWAAGWAPELIYPANEIIEEGTTFKTEAHGQPGKTYLWVVTKFQKKQHLIQYMVSAENRFWTITVQCKAARKQTAASVTYTFTGLNDAGIEENNNTLQKIYHDDLKDWEEDINKYLAGR